MQIPRQLLANVNGRWHKAALLLFMAIVTGHIAEHVLQSVQIFVLGWPRPAARGILGQEFPWLVTSEVFHYLYAVITLTGLLLLLPAFTGRARTYWLLALVFQFWHHFEHLLLLYQRTFHNPLFGKAVPTSILQLFFPRVELHIFYNSIVFVPMLAAFVLHFYPSHQDRPLAICPCAARGLLPRIRFGRALFRPSFGKASYVGLGLLVLAAVPVLAFHNAPPPTGAKAEIKRLGRAPPAFAEVAAAAGVDFHHFRDGSFFNLGGGGAAGDFDNDGWLDLYVTNSRGPNALYHNNGDGAFTDVARAAGLEDLGCRSNGASWGDYDNDGRLDLFVAGYGCSKLFRNNADGTFSDVTAAAVISDPGPDYRTMSGVWGDFDQDGFLDLLVVRHIDSPAERFMPTGIQAALLDRCRTADFIKDQHMPPGVSMMEPDALLTHPELRRDFSAAARPLALYRNRGDGTFEDVTRYLGDGLGFPNNLVGAGFKASFLDYNNDGRPDIYVVNDLGLELYPNVLWRNEGPDGAGGWKFTDVSAATGTNLAMYGMGLAAGDYKNEGHLDLYVTDMGSSHFLENQNGVFKEVTKRTGTGRGVIPENGMVHDSIGWGAIFADLDNDGWLDLYYVAGYLDSDPCMNLPNQPNALFMNKGDGTFADVSKASKVADPGIGREVVAADFFGNGLLDLYVVNMGSLNGQPGIARLYRNSSRTQNTWLEVRLEGTAANRFGVGARVAVTAGGHTRVQYMGLSQGHTSQSVTPVHFGLGSAGRAEMVEIRWPSGTVQTLRDVPASQVLTVKEPSSGN